MNKNHLDELKRQYNKLLAREKKGEEYLDDTGRTEEEYLKWLPEFQKITNRLNALLKQIGSFTAKEVLHGFKI